MFTRLSSDNELPFSTLVEACHMRLHHKGKACAWPKRVCTPLSAFAQNHQVPASCLEPNGVLLIVAVGKAIGKCRRALRAEATDWVKQRKARLKQPVFCKRAGWAEIEPSACARTHAGSGMCALHYCPCLPGCQATSAHRSPATTNKPEHPSTASARSVLHFWT